MDHALSYSVIDVADAADEADSIAPDSTPLDPPEYACRVCGTELSYSGRGRKPQYCDEHKKSKTAARKSGTASAANIKLAEAAADVLAQFNDIAATVIFMGGMPVTSSRLADKNPVFRAQCMQALSTDPALCRSILSAGNAGARGSLAFAYGILLAALLPTAYSELREKRRQSE